MLYYTLPYSLNIKYPCDDFYRLRELLTRFKIEFENYHLISGHSARYFSHRAGKLSQQKTSNMSMKLVPSQFEDCFSHETAISKRNSCDQTISIVLITHRIA